MNQLPEIDDAKSKKKMRLDWRIRSVLFCWAVVWGLILSYGIPCGFSEDSTQGTTKSGSVLDSSVSEESSEATSDAPSETPAPAPEEEVVIPAEKEATAPGNVSLDFKDADILNVLRVLSLKSGTNIVAGPEVQGTVTIRLQDVPWEKAMEVVLRTYGYVYEREANIIRVTTKDNLATEELVTETFVLNYTTAVDVETAIKDVLTERGRVKSVPKANTIIVSDAPTNMYKVSQVIRSLDQVTPQCYIDAKVISTTLGENENLGIDWNVAGNVSGSSRPVTFPFTAPGQADEYNPLSGRAFRYFYPGNVNVPAQNSTSAPAGAPTLATPSAMTLGTLNFQSFTAALGFLRSRTNTKIISNPRIVVLNNQTAKIQVGNEIPIPTFERNETTGSFVISGFSYRDTGVVLKVTPHINQSREILVDLKPEVSKKGDDVDFSGSGSTGGFKAPSFETTTAETQLLIRDGETIAIGGLLKDVVTVESDSVPGLSKIPVFGRLFRNTVRSSGADKNQKQETLFFITITIVDTQGQPALVQPVKAAVNAPSAAQPPVVAVQKAPV